MSGNFSEFGPAESGTRLAELDDQNRQMQQVKQLSEMAQMQEAQARIPLLGAQTEHTQAQARLTAAQASQAENEAAALSKIASGQGVPGDASGKISDMLLRRGLALTANGAYTAGTKLLTQASTAAEHEAIADYRSSQADEMRLRRSGAVMGRFGSILGSVSDPRSYAGAVSQILSDPDLAQDPKVQEALQALPQDYGQAAPVIQQMVRASMKASEQAGLELNARRTQATERNAQNRARVTDARVAEIGAHTDLLKNRYQSEVTNEGERSEAALETKKALIALRNQQRALKDAQTIGVLPANPKPIPMTAEGRPNAGGMVINHYYKNAQGQVARWDGSSLHLVPTRAAPVRSAAPVSESTDDDDED